MVGLSAQGCVLVTKSGKLGDNQRLLYGFSPPAPSVNLRAVRRQALRERALHGVRAERRAAAVLHRPAQRHTLAEGGAAEAGGPAELGGGEEAAAGGGAEALLDEYRGG